MIRRNLTLVDGTPLWLLISQVEHARVSGELTEFWQQPFPSEVVDAITQHDDGWAYKVDGVFSEAFPTHAAALKAAQSAAAEQRVPGSTTVIQYETADGKWHTETARGSDRPTTIIKDSEG